MVIVRKVLEAPREEVFDAWLDPGGMALWMRPGSVTHCAVTLQPEVGGLSRIVMSAPAGEIVNHGKILKLERPSKLQFSWYSSRWDNEETLLTVELREVGGHCELILTHERFPIGHSAPQLLSGWNEMLNQLGQHFDSSRGQK